MKEFNLKSKQNRSLSLKGHYLWGVLLMLSAQTGLANITLPKIFTDNMVLQRDVKVPVWGWADKGEKITVSFAGKTYSAKAAENGKWLVYLDPVAVGGPYEMIVKGKNLLILKNIMMGDVWICSGQSNMEWPVSNVKNAQMEVATANYSNIRLFTVPKKIGNKPVENMDNGRWDVCSPATVGNFSAVGYFFGRKLNQDLNIPIGLINLSWGGTIAETWMSPKAVNGIEDFKEQMKDLGNLDWDKYHIEVASKAKQWEENIERNDLGLSQNWKDTEFNDSDWATMALPQLWESTSLGEFDGVVWFRTELVLNESEASSGITLSLGMIDDSDVAYINGNFVGSTTNKYNEKRTYRVAPGLLKQGKNVIAVRVIDTGGGGGIWGDSQDLAYTSSTGSHSLAGEWKYRPGIKTDSKPDINIGPNSFPTLLFNGMINPLLPIAVRGAIWYQGESNSMRAFQYRTVLPALISDWRIQFNNPNMPFYIVQLANYKPVRQGPTESDWAELREAQLKTLSMPNTGMAVTIDIGDADDIHPRNKQTVGYRLALPALKQVYGKDIVFSGPVYKSMSIEGNKIRIRFDQIGSGLVSWDKYGYVKGFTIAGDDKRFKWAKAYIEGNDVIVYNETIESPVAVRYAWADNPADANLYNKEDLPASPFRTDDWKGITQK